ncbi:MAG: AI-2E family transporter [Clostridiales bacterium]|nr:AI-2E family transporter [Clostridiales bacterium]
MSKKLFRSILGLMTVFVAMIFVVLRFSGIMQVLARLAAVLAPLVFGGALFLALLRPYNQILRLYQRIFRRRPKKGRIAKPLAIFTIYLGLLLVVALVLLVLIPQIKESAELFYSNINLYIRRLEGMANRLLDSLGSDLDLSFFEEMLAEAPSNLSSWLSTAASYIVPGIFSFTSSFISVLFNIIVGFVFSVYLLASKDTLKVHFKLLLERWCSKERTECILFWGRETVNTFTGFIWGQLTEAVILGSLCFVGMLIFRFQYPVLISVLIAITSVIPIVGGFIGAIPAILILLMIDPMQAIWFTVFIIFLQQFESNLIYPHVMGDNIGLSGIWVLVAVIVGGGLFGIWGMLIGVPAAAVIYKMLWRDVSKNRETKGERR